MSPAQESTADESVERAWRELVEAFRPAVDVLQRVCDDLQPALAPLAAAVERGEVTLEPAPVERGCHCLCLMHQSDGMFCAGYAVIEVPMHSPTVGAVEVPMCIPCSRWWLNCRPEHLAATR